MMDIEKLIEKLQNAAGGPEGIKMCHDAATTISALQAENEKLRAELEQKSKLIAQQARMMGYEIIEDDCDQIATKSNSEAMTIEQYQKAAARTAAGKCRDLANAGLGLTGEAGEVADIIKKHLYQGHDLPRDKIVEELGDLMWYVSLTASLIGVDLKAVMQANIEKLWRRYPNGFRPEDSVHREDEK